MKLNFRLLDGREKTKIWGEFRPWPRPRRSPGHLGRFDEKSVIWSGFQKGPMGVTRMVFNIVMRTACTSLKLLYTDY